MRHIGLGFVFLFGLIFSFVACQKEDESNLINVENEYPGVDIELWEYFARFEHEAEKRGLTIDLKERGISAEIIDVDGENVGGVCTYHEDDANHIDIDRYIWNNTSDYLKELILFHELGHCYLLRDHRNDAYSDGRCKSLMRSGTTDCFDSYNSTTRTVYLNELFDPSSVN